ncbi:S26 family signal peptidase, partial [Acinetobacter baumannii]
QSADGKLQLEVISSQVIPKNEIFVSTPHKDSLDSRYAKVGTINKQYILGKAYEIF